MIWRYLIEGPWIVFVAYWLVSALKTRGTVSQEPFASRYGILFLEIEQRDDRERRSPLRR